MPVPGTRRCGCCGGTPTGACCDCDVDEYVVITESGGFVSVSGNVALSGTGIVSVTDFYSWSGVGADGVNVGGTVTGTTASGVGFTATVLGSGHFERRNSQFPSYSGDFTAGEPLLMANIASGYPGDIQIDFDEPIGCAGFRVEHNTATFRNDFFIKAYLSGVEVTYTPGGSNVGLDVDASGSGENSTLFFGIGGCCNSTPAAVFDRLVVGYSGIDAVPFAISTLEVCRCM